MGHRFAVRQQLVERKEHREQIAAKDKALKDLADAKDAEIRSLTKELVQTARGLDLLREKHERVLGHSSNPSRT